MDTGATVRSMTAPEPTAAHVVLRLGVTGELGRMDYAAVLTALQDSFELLQRTAQRVLGDRAAEITWQLSGLQESSAMTLIETHPTDHVTADELTEVAMTYTADLADPGGRLPEDDVPLLRKILIGLQRHSSGGLLAQVESDPAAQRALLDPATTLPSLDLPRPAELRVIGSVTGRLEGLNVHQRLQASLWNELDRRRVLVTFPETAYAVVHAALRKRVEVFGVLVEDADGRPLRVRLEELEVLTGDDELPTLSSLFGTMPELTAGLSAEEHLYRNQQELGLG